MGDAQQTGTGNTSQTGEGERHERMVVGIDPGTTAAVAVLDLEGGVVATRSAKEFPQDRIIAHIIGHGKPLIVATDVSPVPAMVEKVATSLGADLHVPDEDLKAAYKEELVEGSGEHVQDAHTRDALAAAEYARRAYRDTFNRVRDRVPEPGLFGPVVDRVVREGQAIGAAIRAEKPSEEEQEAEREPGRVDRDWQRVAERRKDRINLLEKTVENLEEYVELLKEADTDTRMEVDEDALKERNERINALRDRVQRLEAEKERFQERAERLADAVAKLRDGWRFVPEAQEGDWVYTEQPAEADADVVFAHRPGDATIPLDALDGYVQIEDGVIVPPDAHTATQTTDDDGDEEFFEWLDSYRERHG